MRRVGSLCVMIGILVGSAGCAGMRSMAAGDATSPVESSPVMDQSRLEQIFSDQVEAISGPTGALQTQIDGIQVYCLSDPSTDRMRLIAPFARVTGMDPRIFEVLLRANFHGTLDARYAISDDYIFATYMHPISSLTKAEIESALSQVVSLVKTFGTTFSSGVLVIPEPIRSGPPGDAEDDDAALP